MRYFITFACYGTHLHGDTTGSVDRHHNRPASPLLETDPQRESAESRLMKHPPYLLGQDSRRIVLEAIIDSSVQRGWTLLAAHVRTTHVHAVVEAEEKPEKIMHGFKAKASERLNRTEPSRKRWARHGSTRWLWKDEDVQKAIRYIIEEQGNPMAVFIADHL